MSSPSVRSSELWRTERADDDVGHSLPFERPQQCALLAVGVVGDDGRLPRPALGALRVS